MLRQVNGVKIPALTSYLAACFPKIPSSFCSPCSNAHAKRYSNQSNRSTVSGSNRPTGTCRNCGQSHPAGECCAKNISCRACGKIGHFEKYCITTGRQPRPSRFRSKSTANRNVRPVHKVTEESQNESSQGGVYIGSIHPDVCVQLSKVRGDL